MTTAILATVCVTIDVTQTGHTRQFREHSTRAKLVPHEILKGRLQEAYADYCKHERCMISAHAKRNGQIGTRSLPVPVVYMVQLIDASIESCYCYYALMAICRRRCHHYPSVLAAASISAPLAPVSARLRVRPTGTSPTAVATRTSPR